MDDLAQVIKDRRIADIQLSGFSLLMTDESTDIGVFKQLVLVGQYTTNEGVKTSFLQITDLANGTAETIESSIIQYLSTNTIQVRKLCAFESDGAAVMTGTLNGVAFRLRRHSPRLMFTAVTIA